MADEPISRAQRWLDLIAYLLGHRRPVTVEQIFAAVPAYRRGAGSEGEVQPSSVRRMFERDKDELRKLGIPIETETFVVDYGMSAVDGYRLRPGAFYLPFMRILEASGEAGTAREDQGPSIPADDLQVALDALREAADIPDSPFAAEARSAFRKLAFDLGPVPDDSSLLRAEPPGAPELGDTLSKLSDALLRRKRVAFRYHGLARGEETERNVAPYGLLLERGSWYLIGHDELRDDVRMFHAGRIESPVVNGASPGSADYEIPAGFALSDYRERDAWEFGARDEEVAVRVRFAHPMALWAERNRLGDIETRAEDGSAVRRFEVRHVRPFLCWILGLRGEARVLEPPELVDELRALAATIRDAHG